MRGVRLPLLKSEFAVKSDGALLSSTPSGAEASASSVDLAPTASVLSDSALPEEWMQVGDLARESGKSVRAIHLYEEVDLLRPAARSKGRYRLYGQDALVRIRWIGKLQDLGFSLADIKAVVKDLEGEPTAPLAMTKVREVYKKKLDETRVQLARLHSLEVEILSSLQYLEACDSVCEPERLRPSCQCCDHHPKEQAVPDLVAGFRASL